MKTSLVIRAIFVAHMLIACVEMSIADSGRATRKSEISSKGSITATDIRPNVPPKNYSFDEDEDVSVPAKQYDPKSAWSNSSEDDGQQMKTPVVYDDYLRDDRAAEISPNFEQWIMKIKYIKTSRQKRSLKKWRKELLEEIFKKTGKKPILIESLPAVKPLLKGAKKTRNPSWRGKLITSHYEKTGNYQSALCEFRKLDLKNVEPIKAKFDPDAGVRASVLTTLSFHRVEQRCHQSRQLCQVRACLEYIVGEFPPENISDFACRAWSEPIKLQLLI